MKAEPKAFLHATERYTLIASQAVKPEYARFVGFQGEQPLFSIPDKTARNIQYHLYGCNSKKTPQIGSLIIKNPKDTSRNDTLYPIKIHSCVEPTP